MDKTYPVGWRACFLVYVVDGKALGSVVEQRDFGVQVHSTLKVGIQVDSMGDV